MSIGEGREIMDRVPSRAGSTRRGRGVGVASPSGSRSRVRTAISPARGALLALLTASMLAVGAASASAVLVHLGNGKTLSYQPLRGTVMPLAVRPFSTLTNLGYLSLIHISEPTRLGMISYAVFCLK